MAGAMCTLLYNIKTLVAIISGWNYCEMEEITAEVYNRKLEIV